MIEFTCENCGWTRARRKTEFPPDMPHWCSACLLYHKWPPVAREVLHVTNGWIRWILEHRDLITARNVDLPEKWCPHWFRQCFRDITMKGGVAFDEDRKMYMNTRGTSLAGALKTSNFHVVNPGDSIVRCEDHSITLEKPFLP